MTVLGALTRQRRSISSVPWGEWPGEGGGTWSGSTVNNSTALQLLTVYGCNRFICEGISTLPIDTFRGTDGATVPIANPRWLEQPTADLDRVAWLTQILTSLLLDGNAYLRLVYDDRVNLSELVPLDPSKVTVRRNDRTKRKEYLIGGVPVDSFEILHIPGVMKPGADLGMSPLEAARQSIGLGMAAVESGARMFGQGMQMPGVIEDPGDPTPQQLRETARAFARAHSGKDKAHLPGYLTGGATWKSIGVTNEQAQFLETRGYTAAEIAAQLFLIDPTEFGLQGGKGASITYANLEQRNARKVQVTFLPWLVRLERAFSALLARPRFVKFNVDALIRGDTKTQAETFAIATGNKPWMLPSEVRDKLDLAPMDGIDDQPAPEVPDDGSSD